MLVAAFWVLCAASALGAGFAALYLTGKGRRPPAAAQALHAALGAASLALLVLALRRGLAPTGMGTVGFAPTAAGLLALTMHAGHAIAAAAWRRRRPAEILVGTHATLAIAALALLLAVVALE
jgi:hypothetical protein